MERGELPGTSESCEALRALGELATLDVHGRLFLAETALGAETVPELQSALHGLAAHDQKSAAVIAHAVSLGENHDLAGEALFVLYELDPDWGARRAFDLLEQETCSAVLSKLAEEIVALYAKHNTALADSKGSAAETLVVAKQLIRAQIASGNGNYYLVQPEGCQLKNQGEATARYVSGAEEERVESLNYLREQIPPLAEMLALDAVIDESPLIRKIGISTLYYLRSTEFQTKARELRTDVDENVASFAQKLLSRTRKE